MGITDFLPNVLPSAGIEVDLRRYSDGIHVMAKDGHHGKRQKIRRPLRIGLDVSHWVYRASLRFGDMLADPGHLTNNGRYQILAQQRQQQQRQQQQFNDNLDTNNQNEVQTSATDRLRSQKEKELFQKYISQCVFFVMQRIQSLQRETNAELLVVLDGASPPVKIVTVQDRAKQRQENARIRDAPVNMDSMRIVGRNNNGNAVSFQDAFQVMQVHLKERTKANRRAGAGKHHITIIEELLSALRINQIPFLVAPYEADGQLAWLSKEKFIDLVITEDSDMIAQGGLCMLYKMDLNTRCDNEYIDFDTPCSQPSFVPKGILLLRENLGAVTISNKTAAADHHRLCLRDMTDAMLSVIFVAMGSDYCDKLKGIGITTACDIVNKAFLQQNETCPLVLVFKLLFQRTHDKTVRHDPKRQAEYKTRFLAALLIYRHPIVYNPFQQRCVVAFRDQSDPELTTYEPYAELLEDNKRLQDICGNLIDPPMATLIAEGWVSARRQKLYESAKNNRNLPKTAIEYFKLDVVGTTNKDGALNTDDCAGEHKEDDRLSRVAIFDDPESESSDSKRLTSREESQATIDHMHLDKESQLDTQDDNIQLDTQER